MSVIAVLANSRWRGPGGILRSLRSHVLGGHECSWFIRRMASQYSVLCQVGLDREAHSMLRGQRHPYDRYSTGHPPRFSRLRQLISGDSRAQHL